MRINSVSEFVTLTALIAMIGWLPQSGFSQSMANSGEAKSKVTATTQVSGGIGASISHADLTSASTSSGSGLVTSGSDDGSLSLQGLTTTSSAGLAYNWSVGSGQGAAGGIGFGLASWDSEAYASKDYYSVNGYSWTSGRSDATFSVASNQGASVTSKTSEVSSVAADAGGSVSASGTQVTGQVKTVATTDGATAVNKVVLDGTELTFGSGFGSTDSTASAWGSFRDPR